jgi:hypothetical protein
MISLIYTFDFNLQMPDIVNDGKLLTNMDAFLSCLLRREAFTYFEDKT